MKWALLLLCGNCLAQPLPGTRALELQGDPARYMVDGIVSSLKRLTADSVARRAPSRERLREILGVVDARVSFDAPGLLATTAKSALLGSNDLYTVYAVRWQALRGITAEGVLYQPAGPTVARVITLPDAGGNPEEFAVNQALAAAGCQVLSPVLIDRRDTWSGNPRFRMTNQPHREFVYRMAFEAGRHPWGYEVQKALAAVDWFAAQSPRVPVGIWGYGDGGAVAFFAAALDERIAVAGVSGYFGPREGLWQEPLYRNVFGLLKDFGDAELAALIAPRMLMVDTTPGPSWSGPSEADPNRRGAAPGVLAPARPAEIEREAVRARALRPDSRIVVASTGVVPFLRALGAAPRKAAPLTLPVRDASGRLHRQFDEMVEFTQRLIRDSQSARDRLWAKADRIARPEDWKRMAPEYRARLWDGVIGRLPESGMPLNIRSRKSYYGAKWDGYEILYDVAPDVSGYGVLLLPRDIRAGERRPVLVAQHGLEGRPQNMFGLPETDRENGAYTNYHFYQNIGSRMAEEGYIVYLPQNPYIGDFRRINRLANPLGLSLFSFILAQHQALLRWLGTLPFVDASHIGFYGLSYGGKTALRVPALLEGYAYSICSGDFNDWIAKVAGVDQPFSYMFTQEYEIPEFDLASVANHGEMAKMIAPRPFMVERGHRDGVGIDEWVAAEYAKVQRFYDEMGIGDRTAIEYFDVPHMIHARGTLEFIRKWR